MHRMTISGSAGLSQFAISVCKAALFAAAMTVASHVQAATINFDTVANGTNISHYYAGVTLSAVNCPYGTNVYARKSATAASPSNVVTLIPASTSVLTIFDRRFGGVQATFTTPKRSVSIRVQPVLLPEHLGAVTAKPFLQAFDAAGKFLGVVYYPIAYGSRGYGTYQTLTISSKTANIKYVQFSSQYISGQSPVYGNFDDLSYTP